MDEEAFYRAMLKTAIDTIQGWIGRLWKKKEKKEQLSIEEIKKRIKILFVDDEAPESLISNIRNAGWNVNQIEDVTSPDGEAVRDTDIFFIDYKGVGAILSPSEEGIGLLKMLKGKYPKKKFVFYSGYAGFIPGHEVHNIADEWIPKHSDPYVYIELIESIAYNIYE